MPLERQIIYNGVRYIMNCTPPLEVISKENNSSSFIEAVGVWQSSINNYLTIGRIDKERIVAMEVHGKKTSIVDILELDNDLIEATITYLKSVGLNGFAENIDDQYYGFAMDGLGVSIKDLC